MTIRTTTRAAIAAIGALTLVATAACSTPAAGGSADGAGVTITDSGLGSDLGTAVAHRAQARSAGFVTDTPALAPGQRAISVTATGTATGTPDTLTVQLGVQTQATTAGAALSANNTKANALIAALTKQGIAKKDLATSDLAIYPTYSDNGSSITGYQVTNTVTATLRDVAKAGAVIDAAARAAGDAIRLNQVGFSFDDESALRAAARADAVKQGLAQAKQLATAAGVTLGPIVSITEDSGTAMPQPMYERAAADSGASMPVLSGQSQLTVTVQMVVSIG
jgi:uncharacterized protein YggE